MSSNRENANAIRFLSMDAVQQAKSGHPGMPMGMADIAEALWNGFLKHNPKNPKWTNRDRFVLSNGHGCMLLYSLLHLTGYDLTIDDLMNFRQLHSKTPGHPEFGETPGVETTTGPLGQGVANAVGMAMAEKHLASQFNREGFPIIDHYTYAFVGDGCLMEGISHEVCSLAGTYGLGKLIVFYDDNDISIDGEVHKWFSDDTPKRFESYGWHVIKDVDGHDAKSIQKAILESQAQKDKPSIICCRTKIGFGSPNLAGTAKTHGAPLGDDEINATRKALNWSHAPFEIPDTIYAAYDAKENGQKLEDDWNALFKSYEAKHPELAKEFVRRFASKLPQNFQEIADSLLNEMLEQKQSIATRKASQICINHFTKSMPELMGGSADLSESNLTNWKGVVAFSKETPEGQYVHYGVREFGMSAIMNGIALYGGLIPFGGTFLTFSDYAKNAVRLAAMIKAKSIFVYTHDSIGLGEDGPTHQAVEHTPSLRLIPGLSVWRPCDTVESAVAWQYAIENNGPTALLFTRQGVPFQERDQSCLKDIAKGGYILLDAGGTPDIIFIATGSEVDIAVSAAKELIKSNKKVRVVSMPSTDVFLSQDQAYQEKVLPSKVTARIAIEAATTCGWYRFLGSYGKVIGIDSFGASAKASDLFKEFGFTKDHVLSVAKELLMKTSMPKSSLEGAAITKEEEKHS